MPLYHTRVYVCVYVIRHSKLYEVRQVMVDIMKRCTFERIKLNIDCVVLTLVIGLSWLIHKLIFKNK